MNAFAQPVHHLHPEDFSQYSLRALLDEARLLMNQERAVQYRLAAVLRELDARAHVDNSPMRLPRWLHDTFGLTFGAAREKVRTARALGALPHIDSAFRDGQLSYSKVRALTRAATPENEQQLLQLARQTSAEGVEKIVRHLKHQECLEDAQALIKSRSLSTRWDDTGALVVHARLTPEQGEVFLKAMKKAMEAMQDVGADSEDAEDEDSYWAHRADALAHIMADSLSGRQSAAPADRHQVIVHVSADTLSGTQAGHPRPKNVPAETLSQNVPAETFLKNVSAETPLHPETLRRLACDGALAAIVEKPNGDPLSVGRKTRAIPVPTRRALVARDRHCQFPGCAHDRYVEGHHIVHWARGGETKLTNLILLCSRHHRAVHELGYHIERLDGGEVLFTKPGSENRQT